MYNLNLFVVRHGETLLNKLRRNQGWIDSDLTKEGVWTLNTLYNSTNLPPIDAVFCSDLGRARETFSIIQQYCDVNKENVFYTPLLRERFLGSFEGTNLLETRKNIAEKAGFDSYSNLLANKSLAYFIDSTKKYDPNNLAEDFTEFSERVNEILSTIKKSADTNNWENILVVSHANPVSYIIDTLINNEEFIVEEVEIKNGQMIHLQQNVNEWKIMNQFFGDK